MDLHQLKSVVAAAGVIAALAACAGAENAPSTAQLSATPSPAGAQVVLHGRMSLGGDYTYSVPFTAQAQVPESVSAPTPVAASSCAEYVAPMQSLAMFIGPTVNVSEPRPLFVTLALHSGYRGPGTYVAASFPTLAGTAAVSIPEAEGYAVQTYHSTDASPMTLTVRADGSGSFTFDRWRTDEVRPPYLAGHLDGVITWTCGP